MFPQEFIDAFNHVMLYEVGPFWDPSDPDVIKGNVNTKEQKIKVGYVNNRYDRGGETKFGIAQNSTKVRVIDMTLEDAMVHYFNHYWLAANCNEMPRKVALIHFDGCVNHGIKQAAKFLQRALGVEDDGIVGIITLNSLSQANQIDVINSIADQREAFYKRLAEKNPSQKIFLNGWLKRITNVRQYALAY
jgi:lysozyme family protein